MKNKTWYIIGVMSGTSLDGVDLAYIRFQYDKKFTYKIISAVTKAYPSFWKNKLSEAFTFSESELKQIDIEYGTYIGELINDFIKTNNIEKIDFISSHGHTIFHQPDKGFTLQIGNGKTIASTCHQRVICDFRTQDVALGGQGAPLVPIGDALLFSDFDFCLNIGGFANISYDEIGVRKAYDICPANIILNYYTRKIGLDFDNNGAIAKSGKLNVELLTLLNKLPSYLNHNSLGNEIVIHEFIPLIDSFNLDIPDTLCTYTEHFANKIASELKQNTKTLITGGGAYNSYLIDCIKKQTNSFIVIPERKLIEYKEALIFGLLGLLRLENEINCLASVTKASKNHSSGYIFNP